MNENYTVNQVEQTFDSMKKQNYQKFLSLVVSRSTDKGIYITLEYTKWFVYIFYTL